MMRSIPLLAALALTVLVGCNVDNDGDGAPAHLDCDDTNADIGPDFDELCDGLDNNCDGRIDNNTVDAPIFYADFDRDGFGDPDVTTTDCEYDEATGGPDPEFEPYGYVDNSDDCDDALKTVFPGADERCDTIDNDCDGEVDEDDAIDPETWYADSDSDGFGDAEDTVEACDQPAGYVGDATDCDDSSDTANPGADEFCDGEDNDCDGDIDEDDALDAAAWFRDADEDGFGTVDDAVFACAEPLGYVSDDTDCNDEADTAFPGGTEVCDGLDNDCDEGTSEAGTLSLNATPDVYESIQAAINVAADGDTVYVCAGTWAEDLSSTTPISIIGPNGPEATTLEGTGNGPVITLNGAGTFRVEGMTITGGASESLAGGIQGENTDALEIVDVVLTGNDGYFGGGLVGSESGVTTIEDSRFVDNTAYIGGGALVSDADISGTRFLDNLADFGGGLFTSDGTVTLDDVRIISNYASLAGGGIVAFGGSITGGTVLNNLSDELGGGLYVIDADLEDMAIENNRATDGGGGVVGEGSNTLTSCTVDGNRAPEGGGLYLIDTWTLDGTDVTNNEASSTGGGIYTESGSGTIDSSVISGNTASAGGGMHLVSGTVDVTSSDWGTEADGDDNDPDDIYADQSTTSYSSYGTGETFNCNSSGECI